MWKGLFLLFICLFFTHMACVTSPGSSFDQVMCTGGQFDYMFRLTDRHGDSCLYSKSPESPEVLDVPESRMESLSSDTCEYMIKDLQVDGVYCCLLPLNRAGGQLSMLALESCDDGTLEGVPDAFSDYDPDDLPSHLPVRPGSDDAESLSSPSVSDVMIF